MCLVLSFCLVDVATLTTKISLATTRGHKSCVQKKQLTRLKISQDVLGIIGTALWPRNWLNRCCFCFWEAEMMKCLSGNVRKSHLRQENDRLAEFLHFPEISNFAFCFTPSTSCVLFCHLVIFFLFLFVLLVEIWIWKNDFFEHFVFMGAIPSSFNRGDKNQKGNQDALKAEAIRQSFNLTITEELKRQHLPSRWRPGFPDIYSGLPRFIPLRKRGVYFLVCASSCWQTWKIFDSLLRLFFFWRSEPCFVLWILHALFVWLVRYFCRKTDMFSRNGLRARIIADRISDSEMGKIHRQNEPKRQWEVDCCRLSVCGVAWCVRCFFKSSHKCSGSSSVFFSSPEMFRGANIGGKTHTKSKTKQAFWGKTIKWCLFAVTRQKKQICCRFVDLSGKF